MRRILHIFLLIFALLFAQLGMVAHAASHVAPVSHAGHEGVPSDAACELCVGYAQLGGNVPPSVVLVLPACIAGHVLPAVVVSGFVSCRGFHSRARAPPVFS